MRLFSVLQVVLKPSDIHLSMPLRTGDSRLSSRERYRCLNKAGRDNERRTLAEGEREQGRGRLA